MKRFVDLMFRFNGHVFSSANVPTDRTVKPSEGTWLVLPYRSCWRDARVQKAINRVGLPKSCSSLKPRVSWRLGSPHLANLVNKGSPALLV